LNGFGWVSKFRVTESVVLSIPLNGFYRVAVEVGEALGALSIPLNGFSEPMPSGLAIPVVLTFNSIEWIHHQLKLPNREPLPFQFH